MEYGERRERVKGGSPASAERERGVLPVHSQVRKIKQESEKIMEWSPGKPEIRPLLRELNRQLSRSPLGISGRPISVGDL